jgi:hypothetical protein
MGGEFHGHAFRDGAVFCIPGGIFGSNSRCVEATQVAKSVASRFVATSGAFDSFRQGESRVSERRVIYEANNLPTTRRRPLKGSTALLGLFLAPIAVRAQPDAFSTTTIAESESTMRMMMRLTMPVEKGNEAIASGAWDQTLDHIIETLRPEAAYFYLDGGQRAAMFIYEAEEAEEMAVINEPIFQALNASIEQQPVLAAADLGKALRSK